MIGPVTVPRSGVKETAGCPVDDFDSIPYKPVLREILIKRQLRQGKGYQHALNRRHAEERCRLIGAERLHHDPDKIGRILFVFGDAMTQRAEMSSDRVLDEGEVLRG